MHTQFRDSITIHFHQSKWDFDPSLNDNADVIDSIQRKLTEIQCDSIYRIRHIRVIGSASPEGTLDFNRILSEKRAETIFELFRQYSELDESCVSFSFLGRDWAGVLALAKLETNIPFYDDTISLLERISKAKSDTGIEPVNSLSMLKKLHGGAPYRYLYSHIFSAVRASGILIDYERQPAPSVISSILLDETTLTADSVPLNQDFNIFVQAPSDSCKSTSDYSPLYMDLRTNLLYDALLLPNIGAELYLGNSLTVGINWMYGWWSKNTRHIYWRAYGGELFGRWWFGKKVHEKPISGFHIGIYGQYYMYDFELGGNGEMAGKPGKNLWTQGLFGGGLEFGYSIPIKERLNIDISLGVGYSGGIYHKYKPEDTHYVWQGTYHRHYLGPTKLEIALVWLLGNGNRNVRVHQSTSDTKRIKKGGCR